MRSYNCCKQSDLCPDNKTCKPYHSSQKPWKRFTCESCPDGYYGNSCKQPFRSCQNYEDYVNGSLKSGMYKVVDFNKKVYEVYCHFDFDGAWTLVQSYIVVNGSQNTTSKQFRKALSKNFPVSESVLTWSGYRLRKSRMKSIRSTSHFLMFTNDYKKNRHINQSDYLRILFANIKGPNGNVTDVLELVGNTSYFTVGKGYGRIGKNDLGGCQIQLRQKNRLHVNINSTVSSCKLSCCGHQQCFASSRRKRCMKKQHCCKQNDNSTTQLWFGNMQGQP